MTKEEFLEVLTDCLRGEVTDAELQDSYQYYRDYFSEQESLGKGDEEIITELGSPRLIAHSIIDARGIDEMAERKALRGSRYQYESDSSAEFTVNDENDPDSGWTETDRGAGGGNPFEDGRFYTYQFGGRRNEEPVDDSLGGRLKRIGRQVTGLVVGVGALILIFMLARALFPVILLAFVILMILRMIQN